MQTKIILPTKKNLLSCCELLKKGEVLAVPTETVYGLVADAFNKKAVLKIFEIKKRSLKKPLSCNIANLKMLPSLTNCELKIFKKLQKCFWPGPLTIVVEKNKNVLNLVTANKNTVAIRFSSNPVLKSLTDFYNSALVVPSANVSGNFSKTTPLEVFKELNGKIKIILDGGESFFKVESTIVSLKEGDFKILRQGAVKKEDLEKIIEKKL